MAGQVSMTSGDKNRTFARGRKENTDIRQRSRMLGKAYDQQWTVRFSGPNLQYNPGDGEWVAAALDASEVAVSQHEAPITDSQHWPRSGSYCHPVLLQCSKKQVNCLAQRSWGSTRQSGYVRNFTCACRIRGLDKMLIPKALTALNPALELLSYITM